MDLSKVKPSKNVKGRKPSNDDLYWHLFNLYDPEGQADLREGFFLDANPAEMKNLNEGRWSFTDIMFRKALQDFGRGNQLNVPQRDTNVRVPGRETATPQMLQQMLEIFAKRNPLKKKLF